MCLGEWGEQCQEVGSSGAGDLRLMRNSWGFRGYQRSSFSHCAHGGPHAYGALAPHSRFSSLKWTHEGEPPFKERMGERGERKGWRVVKRWGVGVWSMGFRWGVYIYEFVS